MGADAVTAEVVVVDTADEAGNLETKAYCHELGLVFFCYNCTWVGMVGRGNLLDIDDRKGGFSHMVCCTRPCRART